MGRGALPSISRRGTRSLLLAGIFGLFLGACEQSVQVRGNLPDPDLVSKINPGVHSRIDIANLLGSPSTISSFQDSKWYYIGQKTTQFAFFEPEVLERAVIEVSFDDQGVVSETKTYSLADGQDIDPVDRVTPTEGKKITFLQQLIGNLGRFAGGSK